MRILQHLPNIAAVPAPDIGPAIAIDITAHLCPMTFVRTRLALDRLLPGQVLAVRLVGEEPRRNVPRTAAEQGHEILSSTDHPDGATTILIRKGPTPPA